MLREKCYLPLMGDGDFDGLRAGDGDDGDDDESGVWACFLRSDESELRG